MGSFPSNIMLHPLVGNILFVMYSMGPTWVLLFHPPWPTVFALSLLCITASFMHDC